MNVNRDISTYKGPYRVVDIDATDAYYYADFMGRPTVFDIVESFGVARALADALFVVRNYKWDSLAEMNDCDGGHDVRVVDDNGSLVYAAHELFKKTWIGSSAATSAL